MSNEKYVVNEITLKEEDFWDLMFFYPPSHNPPDNFHYQDEWCGQKLSRVVELILQRNDDNLSEVGDLLEHIRHEEDNPADGSRTWFNRLVNMGRQFSYGSKRTQLRPKIFVRNLLIAHRLNETENDRKIKSEVCKNPNCSFRIEDGNKRAVAFALWLKMGKRKYEEFPVAVIHSTSFRCASASEANRMSETLWFLGDPTIWEPWAASYLRNNGVLPYEYKESAECIIATNDPLESCRAIENARG